MNVFAFALCVVGFICLSLSMKRHFRQLWPQSAPARSVVWLLRCVGYGALTAALLPAINKLGVSIGIVLWCGLLTAAALTVSLLLAYRPRWLPSLGVSVFMVGIVSGYL